MQTSSTTKALARCASIAKTKPTLATVAHIGEYLYSTDSFKAVIVKAEHDNQGAPVFYNARMLAIYPNGIPSTEARSSERQDHEYPDVQKVYDERREKAEKLATFNVRYLLDCLAVLKADKVEDVTLYMKGGDTFAPLIMEGGNVRAIVMPLNR